MHIWSDVQNLVRKVPGHGFLRGGPAPRYKDNGTVPIALNPRDDIDRLTGQHPKGHVAPTAQVGHNHGEGFQATAPYITTPHPTAYHPTAPHPIENYNHGGSLAGAGSAESQHPFNKSAVYTGALSSQQGLPPPTYTKNPGRPISDSGSSIKVIVGKPAASGGGGTQSGGSPGSVAGGSSGRGTHSSDIHNTSGNVGEPKPKPVAPFWTDNSSERLKTPSSVTSDVPAWHVNPNWTNDGLSESARVAGVNTDSSKGAYALEQRPDRAIGNSTIFRMSDGTYVTYAPKTGLSPSGTWDSSQWKSSGFGEIQTTSSSVNNSVVVTGASPPVVPGAGLSPSPPPTLPTVISAKPAHFSGAVIDESSMPSAPAAPVVTPPKPGHFQSTFSINEPGDSQAVGPVEVTNPKGDLNGIKGDGAGTGPGITSPGDSGVKNDAAGGGPGINYTGSQPGASIGAVGPVEVTNPKTAPPQWPAGTNSSGVPSSTVVTLPPVDVHSGAATTGIAGFNPTAAIPSQPHLGSHSFRAE